jgi:hypothetical protein
MQSSLFPKSEAEIEKEYKQKIFLTTLKEGKSPKRKCLFKNVFYLSGLFRYLKMIQSVSVPDDSQYDRRYVIALDKYILYAVHSVTEDESFINSLKRYLSNDFKLEVSHYHSVSGRFFIYFKYNKVRWDLIDYDLQQNHSDNILKKPNGFIYVKNYHKRLT